MNERLHHPREVTPQHITLTAFLQGAGRAVKALPAQWVRVEIAAYSNKNGHGYIDGVEHDAAGTAVARCKITLWKGKREGIERKFTETTGSTLSHGITVLLLLKLSVHEQFGLSATVEDIDPSFTLGDMQRKLLHIRKTLSDEGIIAANKRHPHPPDFTQVCVIAPEGAAGLGDFNEVSDRLQRFGLCRFHVRHALFQGKEAPEQIKAILDKVGIAVSTGFPLDAVVILRGGGATTDLNWLNDLELARAICGMPLPVFTAIGHERDSTVLDDVANTVFDTPSKAAKHIEDIIKSNAIQAATSKDKLVAAAQARLRHATDRANHRQLQLVQTAKHRLGAVQQALTHQRSTLHLRAAAAARDAGASVRESGLLLASTAKDNLAAVMARADACKTILQTSPHQIIEQAGRELDAMRKIIDTIPPQLVGRAEHNIRQQAALLIGLGPAATMKRGFALLRTDDGGEVVTRMAQVAVGQTLRIEMADGTMKATRTE